MAIALCCSPVIKADGILSHFDAVCYGRWPGDMRSVPTSMVLNPAAIGWMRASTGALYGGFNWSQTAMLWEQPSQYEAHTLQPIRVKISAFGVVPLTKRISAGAAIYQPLLISIRWPDDWLGRYIVRSFRFAPYVVQPTVSFTLSERTSVGVAGVIGFSGFDFARDLDLHQLPDEATMRLSANARGYGARFGFVTGLGPLDVGGSVSLPVVFTFDGDGSYTAPGSLHDSIPAMVFTTRIALPSSVIFHMKYDLGNDVHLSVGGQYNFKPGMDSIVLDLANNTTLLRDEELHLRRGSEFSVWAGGGVPVKEHWYISGCLRYATGASVSGHLSPVAPDADKAGLYVSVSRRLSASVQIDFALSYTETATVTGTLEPKQFEATYKSRTWGLHGGIRFTGKERS